MNPFLHKIYQWYTENRRDLPWRSTTDPYLIWVSETILQQTRISQGLPYYYRFIDRFPNVKSLAVAPADELMKIWEGLGYYSRARNMQTAAKMIVTEMGGIFPPDYNTLRKLKGIGDYTASAVASIVYNQPHPVIDGNVIRVLSRYFGISEPAGSARGRKAFAAKASEIMNPADPGFHNQALMEFGALCCVPRNPACTGCPLQNSCFAWLNDMVAALPVKTKKAPRKIRYFYFYLVEDPHNMIIVKREMDDIWKNLYQLPLMEAGSELPDAEILSNGLTAELLRGNPAEIREISHSYRHELTHQLIMARFIRIRMTNLAPMASWITIKKKEIHKFAFPVLVRNYLARKGLKV